MSSAFARPPRPRRTLRRGPTATINAPARRAPLVSQGGQWLKAWQARNPGQFSPGQTTASVGAQIPGFQESQMQAPTTDPSWAYAYTHPSSPQANAPAANPPANVAPAPAPPQKPPTLPSAQASRSAAEEEWNAAQAGVHQGLYQAALRYGDPALIQQYANLGYGPSMVGENPNSALAQVARQETSDIRDVGEARTKANTFFSGRHLADVGRLHDVATRGRAAAYQDYLDKESELTSTYNRAMRDYYAALNAANASELEAAQQEVPEDMGPDIPVTQPPAPVAAPPAKKPKAKPKPKPKPKKRPPKFTG